MVKRLIQAHANQNTIKEILEEDNGEEDDDGFRQARTIRQTEVQTMLLYLRHTSLPF